ncbi:MAG: hypothetical protein QXT81_04905, partial [Candidatus Bathyarchaeia archaeon]
HMTIISSNLLVIMLVLKKSGYKGESVPLKPSDWLELLALVAFAASALTMWFNPAFMVVFIASGVYLLLSEMR